MNFEALTKYLDSLKDRGVPGCDLEVWVNHEPVYRHFTGESHPGKPMDGTETYWLYSATKVFTMTAAMQLVEKGVLKLSDPVSKYLPAYAKLTVKDGDTVRPAKTVMTLENLMAMQSGLDYDLQSPAILACVEKYGAKVTTVQLAEAFAENPLNFDPGTHFLYSLSHDVVGAIIEVASGMPFGEYVRKNIIEPLGMKTMTFHPTEEHFARMAARYHWDEDLNPIPEPNAKNPYDLAELYESGGAGLVGDVSSYILLADALANGGVGRNGARILSQESIDNMRTNRALGVRGEDFDTLCNKFGYGYGLGVRTLIHKETSRSPLGEFGWDGAAGAWTMADPDNHIAAYFGMHVLNCGLAYEKYHPTIRDLIYEGLNA